nr:MAG TPA: hypothetical protein [Caudoviricetes sp.]
MIMKIYGLSRKMGSPVNMERMIMIYSLNQKRKQDG